MPEPSSCVTVLLQRTPHYHNDPPTNQQHSTCQVNGLCSERHFHPFSEQIIEKLGLNVKVVHGHEKRWPTSNIQPWELAYQWKLATAAAKLGLQPLSNPSQSAPEVGSADAAAIAMIEVLRRNKGKTTILALGALTNIAQCAEKYGAEFREGGPNPNPNFSPHRSMGKGSLKVSSCRALWCAGKAKPSPTPRYQRSCQCEMHCYIYIQLQPGEAHASVV